MGRGLVVSGTTGNVTASGGTLAVHKTGLPNAFNVLKKKVVPSAGSGPSTLEVMQKDTLLNADLVLKWKAVSGNIYDPMDDSSGTPVEMPATDIIAVYDDEDLTGEFHMKFTNNDSVDKTYTYELTYEEVPVFDSGRVMTVQKAELLGEKLYFGGRTAAHAMVRRNGTAIEFVLGDESAYTAAAAASFVANGAAVYIGGGTPTDVLLARSGGRFYVQLGDNSAAADISVGNVYANSGSVFLHGTSATDVLLQRVSGGLNIRLGNDSNYGSLACGDLVVNGTPFLSGFSGTGNYTLFEIAYGVIVSAS